MEQNIIPLWFCVDCTILVVNGDASGIEDETQIEATKKGEQYLHTLGTVAYDGETDVFSIHSCHCCGSHLAGQRTKFNLSAK